MRAAFLSLLLTDMPPIELIQSVIERTIKGPQTTFLNYEKDFSF